MDNDTALSIVMNCLRDAVEQLGTDTTAITKDTVIVGEGAILDSISVVSLIVDIEQRLEMEHGVSVTLASEKAMSQRSSPFRTAGVLTDHVCATIAERQAA
jgi:acyl carrier protein